MPGDIDAVTAPDLSRASVAPPTRPLIPAFINAGAGNAAAADEALAKAGGFAVQHVPVAELHSHVRAALDGGARRVLIAGGDGTVGAAAAIACGGNCELAILPAGTLNHLARDLGLPEDLVEAATVAHGTATRSIDVAEVNGHLFLNTSSVGAYARFVQTRERFEKRFGYKLASLFAAVRTLAHLRNFRVSVEIDGVQREYVTPLVFIGVGERELRLPILGSRVKDGERGLHVMIVRSRSGARLLLLGIAAASRGLEAVARTPAMDSFLVDRLRIEPRRPIKAWKIGIDGEIATVEPPLDYRLSRDALNVVVGASYQG